MSTAEWIITAEQLRNCLGSVTVVDVREQDEYEEGHIEGCKLIPLGELSDRAPAELQKDEDIVLYCAMGMRSLEGLMALRMMGYQKLRSLTGGIVAWDELSN